MKVYIETYGCAANRNDSEIMAGLLMERGHEMTSDPSTAEVIIVNTCIVKHTTEEKIKSRIRALKKLYPSKRIIIAGCMVTGEPEIAKGFVLPMIGPRSISKVSDVVEGKIHAALNEWSEKPTLPSKSRFPIKIIQLSEGCLGNCSYCITKFARGRLKSYKPEVVVDAVKKAVTHGYKEIWLTSQDNSSYGMDIGTNLHELLERILSVEGDFKIRVGMMNPAFLKDFDVEIFKDERVFKFVHIPVQSGSNRILGLMKRGYTVEEFEKVVKSFRKIPGITLWTDVIVGFPTETEEEFNETVELIKRIKPDFVNVSRYSNRPGVEARKLKQIPTEVKKERSRLMSKLVDQIAFEKNRSWIGWEGEILIDEYAHGNFIGRNFAYKPVVLEDGELGATVNVKIVDAAATHLKGEKI